MFNRVRGRGISLRKIPVALCMTEVRCLVNRSLESRRRPRYRTCVFHGITVSWTCGCCVSSDRGLRVGLVTRPEESYRVWSVGV